MHCKLFECMIRAWSEAWHCKFLSCSKTKWPTLANIVPKTPIKTIKTDQLMSWFKLESEGELTVLWINVLKSFCAIETKLKLSISFIDLYLQGIIIVTTGEESAMKRWHWIVPAGEFTSPSSSKRGMHRYPSAKREHLGWRPTKISTKSCLISTYPHKNHLCKHHNCASNCLNMNKTLF